MDSLKRIVIDCRVRALELRPTRHHFEADKWDAVADRIESLMEWGAVKWTNYCNETVPQALRFLANNERPIGGEENYNAIHLEQLAGEIERMAAQPLYITQQNCEEHVPGIARCNKCDFTLTVNSLNMDDGTVTAGNAGGICPNGCGDMRPVTWKEWAQEGWARAEQVFNDCKKMRSEQKVFPETSAPGWFDSLESFATNTTAPQYCDGTGAYWTGEIIRNLRAQLEAEKQGATAMRETLKAITDYVDRNTCRHEETHRGGAIWEICDHCGEKWADDEGGRPEFVEPKELVDAREALSSDAGRDYVPAERLRKAEEELDCETRWAYELIEQRDIAEDSLAKAYSLVTDRTQEWSNYFGYTDAIIGIGEAMKQYKRDAERYRWLRERDVDTIHKGGVFAGVTPENIVINEEDLDEYIDSAMLNAVPENKR